MELDVDAVCDGEDGLIGAIMEHLEEAGIHSGDSTCFIPPQNVPDEILEQVKILWHVKFINIQILMMVRLLQ